jgi:glycosyltransferase involved in cell wall biosynthesis
MPDSAPLVSVIIPVYNAQQFIREALDSIFRQTYKNIEVIVVNDGSSDQTENIITGQYKDRVRYFSQANSGPSKARNAGLKNAKGEYVAFLDVDDVWHPNKIEEQVNSFLRNSNFEMIYTDYQVIDIDEPVQFLLEPGEIELQPCTFRQILFGKLVATPTVMIKKDVLLNIGGYNEALLTGEDIELYLKVAQLFRIGFLNKTYVVVRKHKKNLTKNRRAVSGIIDGLNNLCALYPELARDPIIRRAFVYHSVRKGCELFNWDLRKEAVPFFKNAIKFAPFCVKAYLYIGAAHFPMQMIVFIRKMKMILRSK